MIAHVTVRTARINETVEFYQWLLDLPVSRKFSTTTGEIVFLGENETKLEFIEDNKAEKINAKGLTIGFAVVNLDEKIAMLDSKQIPHGPILTPSPNVRFVFFNDLNGCEIQLIQM
jgi:catechol 2,3-dioxygenase-like lactoylglutathione lyase family enzyme